MFEVICDMVCVHLSPQEFAKAVEPDNIKQDLIPLFHNLATDEQVKHTLELCAVHIDH